MKNFLIFVIISYIAFVAFGYNEYETNIIFRSYNTHGDEFISTFDNNDDLQKYCDPTGPYTIIIHGWGESINSIWPLNMINAFLNVRGGCVFFMDYHYYSQLGYFTLVKKLTGIAGVLTKKLQQLEQNGFSPDNAHIFGFSFGAHVTFQGAFYYGSGKVNRIDCCDPAGPAFPKGAFSVKVATASGKDVQCIHTSNDKGTALRYCQKDINMGKCGYSQIGATKPPLLSHGMCPILYTYAFTNDFPLVPITVVNSVYPNCNKAPFPCKNVTEAPDVTLLPPSVMGYNLDIESIPNGEYFSLSGYNPFYNKYP